MVKNFIKWPAQNGKRNPMTKKWSDWKPAGKLAYFEGSLHQLYIKERIPDNVISLHEILDYWKTNDGYYFSSKISLNEGDYIYTANYNYSILECTQTQRLVNTDNPEIIFEYRFEIVETPAIQKKLFRVPNILHINELEGYPEE